MNHPAKPTALVIVFVMAVFTALFGSLGAADGPKENAAKKEMEKLQGNWQLIAGEIFGQGRSFKGPKEEVALEKVIIKGDNWTLRRAKVLDKSGIERKETEQQARYELDPTKKPRNIDLVWTDGDENGKTYPGVYSLDGDTLKICYAREGTERPTGFTAEATKQIKDHCVLMVLKREKVDKSDLENLQGPWLAAAMVIDGAEWPKEKLKQATMFIYGIRLRLEGSIDGEPGWYGGDITLDPARRPKDMDCKEESMNPKAARVYRGIYQLDGDTLKICMAVGVKERPEQFAGGKGLLFMTFQRGKEILHTSEQKKAIAAIKKLGGQTGTSQFRHIEKGELVVENWPGKPVVLVYLEDTKVTDADLAFLKVFPDLRRLDLTTTSVTDAGLIHLKGLTKLELVSLAQTKVTDAGPQHLQGLINLKMLFLGQTMVGDQGLIHLKDLKQLDFLVLEKTQVTDTGLAHLKGLTNLTRLLLDNTKITDAGLAHLAGLTKLQFLELGGTKVTDEGVKNLRKSLPKLEGAR